MLQFIRLFAEDGKVRTLLVLIALDFVFGVVDAIKARTFRLSYVSDFMREDVLGKIVPYFALWSGVKLAGDLVKIPGIDLGIIEGGAFLAIVAALTGSLLSSFRGLGWIPENAPKALVGDENDKEILSH